MLLTSANLPGELKRCREVGIAAYIVKPAKPSELLDTLLTALGAKAGDPGGAAGSREKKSNRPRRILLVEDNKVNQRYATRLLESWGHKVMLADDGQSALAALKEHQFELILMDVQMPNMDGFEATGAIRKTEQQAGAGDHIPIIAMTAFAMTGDRERCLQAGMDDYVSKPIQPEELFSTIEGAVVARKAGEISAPVPEPAGFTRQTLFKQLGDDVAFIAELAEIFRTDCPGMMREIEQSLKRRDAAALTKAAHTLKGTLGTLGAREAAQAALQLELMGRSGTIPEDGTNSAEQAYKALAAAIHIVMPVLASFNHLD